MLKNWYEIYECLNCVAKLFSSVFINDLKLGWSYLATEHTDYKSSANILDYTSGPVWSIP